MPKKSNQKQARKQAFQGKADAAIALLTPEAATDATAAASLIQLLAFRGQWNDVSNFGLPGADVI